MEKKNIEDTIVNETENLFDEDLDKLANELSESLNNIESEKKPEKKKLEPKKFDKKKANKKKILIIAVATFFTVLLITLLVFVVRISACTKECKSLTDNIYSRQEIEEKLKEQGFNTFEINQAIKKCNIDFSGAANKYMFSLIESPTELLSKESLLAKLTEKGFSDEDIEKMLSQLNWNDFLDTYLGNYISNSKKEINKSEFVNSLKKAGFATEDINYLKSHKKWDELASTYIKEYFSKNPTSSKDDAKEYLDKLGYSETEIENIFKNLDWNKQAQECLTAYVKNAQAKEEKLEISRSSFEKILKELGFSESEIQYAVDNYDYSEALVTKIEELIKATADKLISKTTIRKQLTNLGFKDTEIDAAFKKVKWDQHCLNTLKQCLIKYKGSKADALKYLKDNGYDTNEIDAASAKINWVTTGEEALSYLVEGNTKTKSELLKVLDTYGYDQIEINEIGKKVSFSKFAYEYIINTLSSSQLNTLAPTELKKKLNDASYESEYEYCYNQFDFNKTCSNRLDAKLETYLIGPMPFSLKTVQSELSSLGYTDSQINSYDYDAYAYEWADAYARTYPLATPTDMRGKLIAIGLKDVTDEAVDWNERAEYYAAVVLLAGEESGKSLDEIKSEVRSTLTAGGYTNASIDVAIKYLDEHYEPPEVDDDTE